jgi:dihydrodipicolinate synthase/N-acetylneuraminate lyase
MGDGPETLNAAAMNTDLAATRRQLVARLFPAGVPPLWCPLLTHYTDDGSIDFARMTAHLEHVSHWVRGFLIPGSTGDGWELSAAETAQVVQFALEQARRLKVHLLIGVLQPEASAALDHLRRQVAAWPGVSQRNLPLAPHLPLAVGEPPVCGFAVCPPRGEHRTQQELQAALTCLLELGAPLALYQLPQITRNEMGAALVADLARRFPNFVLFKDSSGSDRVALAGERPSGVFLVRGAEGDYARWLKAAGGPYDGLLLSTANGFARELAQMLDWLGEGRREQAVELSARLNAVVQEAFRIVADVPVGNAFANANKALDHFFAFGPKAATVAPPRLHAGRRLPVEVLRAVGDALQRHGFLPERGYVET